jgi:tetratricopeptide (TPR) repeat protein
MKTPLELIQICEEEVRAGRADRVAYHLSRLNLAKLPREVRRPLANLCRRAGLLNLGLKILSPVVRTELIAADAEKAEYAVLLQRSGSVSEALGLLKKVNPIAVPEALLFRAFCHFNRWEYAQAIPILQAYLSSALSPYQSLIGRVNLAAAQLVVGQDHEAESLLAQNLEDVRRLAAMRLEGNCRELLAQLFLRRNQTGPASLELERASQLFGSEKTLDQLFVKKWKAVLESRCDGTVDPLLQFRAQAVEFGDAESVREADLYLVQARYEDDRYQHLYFGSPLAGYRERLAREIPTAPRALTYLFGSRDPSVVLDLQTGQSSDTGLNPGKKLHQVLAVLLRDFYRPPSLGALFAEIFPNEFFDIYSSPSRIHQLLRRTRRWIKESGFPLEIIEEAGGYRVSVTGDFAIRIADRSLAVDANTVALAKLGRFQGSSFRAADARLILGMSATSFRRFTHWALENGHLRRIGESRATTYELCAPNLSVSESAIPRAS